LLRSKGLLINAINSFMAFDKTKQKDPKLNFLLLKTKYEQSRFEEAIRGLFQFMKDHPNAAVYVEGGGTAVGVAALLRGQIDWCMASRPLTPDELNQLAVRYHSLGYSILAARDALSFYVNEQNPVHELTTEQLRGIFSGSISNWKEVGGADAPVRVLRRNSNMHSKTRRCTKR